MSITDKWMNKTWCVYILESYSATKGGAALAQATTRASLATAVQREGGRTRQIPGGEKLGSERLLSAGRDGGTGADG